MYKPSFPLSVPAALLIPSDTIVKGVKKKAYPTDGERINVSFKTFGGTEIISNDAYSVEDTAVIETWYRPDIKSDCRIKTLENSNVYEILGTPEDIEQRHQFLKFKIRRLGGGV